MRENPAGPKTKDEVNQKFDKKIHKINKLRIVGEEVFLDVDNTGIVDNTKTNKNIHKINKLRIVDVIAKKSTFFALEPFFLRFFKMDKTGVFYMSLAFHSHIRC